MLFILQVSAQNDSAKEIDVNKQPIKDFANSVVKKWESNEIDFTKPFSIKLEGVLDKEGLFDKSKTTFTKTDGDEDIVNIVKNGIEAVGNSYFLKYLTELGVRNINITLIQDLENTTIKFSSKMDSNTKAKTTASGLNGLFAIAKIKANQTSDEKLVMRSIKTARFSDSTLLLEFEMPALLFHDLILRGIRKASARRQK